MLVDVTNHYLNSRNHGFDARAWLRGLERSRIVQLQAAGYSVREGRYEASTPRRCLG